MIWAWLASAPNFVWLTRSSFPSCFVCLCVCVPKPVVAFLLPSRVFVYSFLSCFFGFIHVQQNRASTACCHSWPRDNASQLREISKCQARVHVFARCRTSPLRPVEGRTPARPSRSGREKRVLRLTNRPLLEVKSPNPLTFLFAVVFMRRVCSLTTRIQRDREAQIAPKREESGKIVDNSTTDDGLIRHQKITKGRAHKSQERPAMSAQEHFRRNKYLNVEKQRQAEKRPEEMHEAW